MGKYLDIIARVEVASVQLGQVGREQSDKSEKGCSDGVGGSGAGNTASTFTRLTRFSRTLHELERRCPAHVDIADWQQAVIDGSCFVARWGAQADGLGWTARDLFGLHVVSNKPSQRYRRLSRYDETGLIWLLLGRPVVMLTDTTAAIENPSGASTTYYRRSKPSLGPVGGRLDNFR